MINEIVSPIPAFNFINITLKDLKQDAKIIIFNNLGIKLLESKIEGRKPRVNIETLKAGLYHYVIINGEETCKGNLIKE